VHAHEAYAPETDEHCAVFTIGHLLQSLAKSASAPSCSGNSCCAQQTGMHEMVLEALLIATYSTWGWTNTYTHRKSCRSRTCLVRIAGPCPAVPFQLVPAQLAYERTSVRTYEPANSHRSAACSQQLFPLLAKTLPRDAIVLHHILPILLVPHMYPRLIAVMIRILSCESCSSGQT